MVDVTANRLALSATEIRALNPSWPEVMVESYLALTEGLASVAQQVTLEVNEITNEVTNIIEAGADGDLNRARLMTLSRHFKQLQNAITELQEGQNSILELIAGLSTQHRDPRIVKINKVIVEILEMSAGFISQNGLINAKINTLDNSIDSRVAARVSLGN